MESLEFYTALYITTAPAILTFALAVLVILSMPIYLYETRNGK